jgi:hypothetical protein
MENREDVMGMIGGLELGLKYAGVVGQVPALHPWLMGNRWVAKLLTAQPLIEIADPLRTMVNVSPYPSLSTHRIRRHSYGNTDYPRMYR